MMEIAQKELAVFNKYTFYEEPHLYTCNGEPVSISVTSLIDKYTQEFDQKKWAPIKAKQRGITTAEMIFEWEWQNKVSQVKGTHLHRYMEHKWRKETYMYPREEIILQFGFDVLKEFWPKLTAMMDKFYNRFKDDLIYIGLELIVGSEAFDIAGSIDFFCYSKKLNGFIIIDYKTNKNIKMENKHQKMKDFLSHLDDCNYIHYSLQTNMYKYIIQTETNLLIVGEFLIWFNENNEDFQIITCKNLYKEAQQILERRRIVYG